MVVFNRKELIATGLIFRGHDQGNDQTVQTEYFGEDQNQNHADVQSKGEQTMAYGVPTLPTLTVAVEQCLGHRRHRRYRLRNQLLDHSSLRTSQRPAEGML